MIDFACKRFRLDEIIKCSLGLTKTDYRVLELLIAHDETAFTTQEIAEELNIDLSSAQRSCKKLHETTTIRRGQENYESGGYSYTYQAASKKHIRQTIADIIDNWSSKVKSSLKHW